jgi:hypothetical protein
VSQFLSDLVRLAKLLLGQRLLAHC